MHTFITLPKFTYLQVLVLVASVRNCYYYTFSKMPYVYLPLYYGGILSIKAGSGVPYSEHIATTPLYYEPGQNVLIIICAQVKERTEVILSAPVLCNGVII